MTFYDDIFWKMFSFLFVPRLWNIVRTALIVPYEFTHSGYKTASQKNEHYQT